jgi:hypothetical protein
MSRIFCLIFIFFATEALAQSFRETSFDERPMCERQNGVWRSFGDGCADSCEAKLDSFMVCTQAITSGCDCGGSKCWNGNGCVNLNDYKVGYEAEKAKEQVALAKAKKERQAAYKEYQQSLLDKLSGQVASASDKAQNFIGDTANQAKQMITSNNQQTQTQPGGNLITQVAPQNQAQINAQNQTNAAPINVEIPPFFLQQQKQQAEAAKKSDPLGMDNLEKQALGLGGDKNAIPALAGLPEIPLP